MYMFSSVFESIPKNRSEWVNELDIPDLTLSTYVSDEIISEDSSLDRLDIETVDSSESSLAFSRVMSDVDSEYQSITRPLKRRIVSDPWDLMKTSLEAFPPDYLDSMDSYYSPSPSEDLEERIYERERLEELRELELRMLKYFEECRVFEPEDPALAIIERALDGLDLKRPTSSKGRIQDFFDLDITPNLPY